METSLINIKNTYAQEQGFQSWEELQSDCYGYSEDMESHMDEICIRAQKAALEKAAENVTTVHHANQSSDEIEKAVHYTKHSIINPENLIR